MPGETIDLGTIDVTSDKRPEPVRNKAKDASSAGADAAATEAAGQQASAESSAAASARVTNVSGRVTLPDGQPAAGAHVAVIATRIDRGRGGDLAPRGAVLTEGTTDDGGNYRLSIGEADSQTYRNPHLIARMDGFAVGHERLNLDALPSDLALTLEPDQPIRGRLIDLEGKPAAGVQLVVRSFYTPSAVDPDGKKDILFEGDGGSGPEAWPGPITSDAEGRFTVRGAAADQGVYLTTTTHDRFAPQWMELNTGRSEQGGTGPTLVRNGQPGEELLLPLAPAQWFEGQITFEDTGQPAGNARLTIWAAQEPYGGMYQIAGRADAQGHYRICPRPGNYFGINVYPPDGCPTTSGKPTSRVPSDGNPATP